MARHYQSVGTVHLEKAWSLLNEYNDFRGLARHRKKIEAQLRDANIPLTYVPWESMVRAVLCHNLFSDKQLKEMNSNTVQCCTLADIASSQAIIDFLLENDREDEKSLTETWFAMDELKERFQQANNILPTGQRAKKEMLHKLLGYPIGYVDDETDYHLNENNHELFDLTNVLSVDEQRQMCTGDLIEFSGNRLHDAFYIYRLPEKGIWAQIQQMWSKHQITDFEFNAIENQSEDEELILVPAMDEYGYGVPYLFATRPTQSLPEGACHKYVDINCPLVSMHHENPTIALVQQHLNERLANPVYQDKYMDIEMTVKSDRFPQEYVACVIITDGPNDNVSWTQRRHYNGKEVARDLNDNLEIFFSRRILECEKQYKQKIIDLSST
ncbi:unnamed protein product [Rotaria magnacalcarata]|uniref:Uncharacterized protein n=1 Tax=Rotaria magnacalcarata TaxID=392030 RepID=A0A819CT23_9BILA|nr:unnamed protein product [Rotaria magnacalcarata]CAF3812735.1 unnamed protein product [Rotaria magnacalcarata]